MRYFARICAHARSWREFAKCRFAHFPSFFSVHVDTYDIGNCVMAYYIPGNSIQVDMPILPELVYFINMLITFRLVIM